MVDHTLVGGSWKGMSSRVRPSDIHAVSYRHAPGGLVNAKTTTAQIRLNRVSPAYWRITFNNPPLNVMGPQFVQEFRDVVTAIEDDEQVKVVVFDSAVEGYFLNHSDFLANFDDLKRIPAGPTGLEAWPDGLVRLTRAPVVSVAVVRGGGTGDGRA